MGEMNTEIRYSLGSGVEVRAEGDSQPKLVGYAAVYDKPSVMMRAGGRDFREVIKPGAFAKTLADTAAEVKADIGHDRERVFARRSKGTLILEDDATGLIASIVPGDDSDGRDALVKVKRGDVDQMSFEFRVRPGGESWQLQEDKTWLRFLTDVELYRVTLTAEPAYPDTSIAVRSLEAHAVEAKPEPAPEAKAEVVNEPAKLVVPGDYYRLKLDRLK